MIQLIPLFKFSYKILTDFSETYLHLLHAIVLPGIFTLNNGIKAETVKRISFYKYNALESKSKPKWNFTRFYVFFRL